jgi:diguanylate cyclase (GGDEF)-like protein
MPARTGAWLAAAALLLALEAAAAEVSPLATSASRGRLRPVNVQLNWKHQFQFAGFYQAIEQGYYREAGLDVQLAEVEEGKDPIDAVIAGQADFGVGASELALRRARGEPLVALATILQHSPLVLLVRRSVTDTVQGLAGRRVMIMPHETELYAYFQREKLPLSRITTVPHSFNPQDLIAGRVDALSGYLTDEPFLLRKQGFQYVALTPRTSGVDFYADTLFTTTQNAERDRGSVLRFLEATLKGWQHAMDHPAETADLILKRYGTRHSREHLLFEAEEMRRLMQPELIPIGYMNPGRWQHIADVYGELGMLPQAASLDGFLFERHPQRDYAWLYRVTLFIALALLIAAIVAVHQRQLNRVLRGEIERRKAAEGRLLEANASMRGQLEQIRALQERLEEQALRDSLTGLYNRRYLDETLERELARAEREQKALSIVLLDIDRFKLLNDTHGHQAGDAVLKRLADLLNARIRPSDLACRWGGEEFVVVLPNMPLDAAVERADLWRSEFAAERMRLGDASVASTLSAGIATFPVHGATAAALMAAADTALYRAKSLGRDRVEAARQPRQAVG